MKNPFDAQVQVGINTHRKVVMIRASDGDLWVLHDATPETARKLAADLLMCAEQVEKLLTEKSS